MDTTEIDSKQITFKLALERLEEIVKQLEDETLDLEVALERYEEGVRLARFCNKYLEDAKLRIKQLSKDTFGETVIKETEDDPNL